MRYPTQRIFPSPLRRARVRCAGGRYRADGASEARYEPASNRRVLRNLLGIRSAREMERVEERELTRTAAWALRSYENDRCISAGDLCDLHSRWLTGIYAWAEFLLIHPFREGGGPRRPRSELQPHAQAVQREDRRRRGLSGGMPSSTNFLRRLAIASTLSPVSMADDAATWLTRNSLYRTGSCRKALASNRSTTSARRNRSRAPPPTRCAPLR